MEDAEKTARVSALREGLKNGRAGQSSKNSGSDHRDDDFQTRATFQTPGGTFTSASPYSGSVETDAGKSGNNGRSVEEKSIRVRRTDRRHGEDYSSSRSGTEEANGTKSDRLVSDGTVPERLIRPDFPDPLFKQGSEETVQLNDIQQKLSSKYPKLNAIMIEQPDITARDLANRINVSVGTAHTVKKQWEAAKNKVDDKKKEPFIKIPDLIRKGSVLSKQEVAEIKDSFTAAIESDFEAIDQYLLMRRKAAGIEDDHPVWSDLDTEELEAFTRIMVKWGQHNAAAATVVRGVVDSADYIEVGTIFIPRIKKSVEIMRETRKPRSRRGQGTHAPTDK